ncbi:MAG: sodium-dependent bicarbonate transport family permease [Burkholderiales bacterium]|nr:sodium-dependent bicarbonate transport family permease [Burkholderiales bacterium]
MNSFLDPAVLFFALGIFAGLVKSDLQIPAAISRFLSLYLLMALGLKGGYALARSGVTAEVAVGLGCAVVLALVVPLSAYFVLRRFLPAFDAAAVAATYGSVSAVTFITATQYLDERGVVYGGHMAAAMALMESPAIVLALIAANLLRRDAASRHAAGPSDGPAAPTSPTSFSLGGVIREALTSGPQMLLLGSMLVGLVSGDAGKASMQPFSGDLFKGMLAFFLLDMGLLVARNLGSLRGRPPVVILYGVAAPPLHAGLALALAGAAGLSVGDGALLAVLAASASYIAVPAVLRHAIPEAHPSLYFGMSLGLTFPMNILLGIPLYVGAAVYLLH